MFKWGICVLLSTLNCAFALEKSDYTAIDKVISGYTYAWNECCGKGFGEGFTQDADFVNIFGTKFSGKEEIEVRHVKILETFLKDSKMEILKTDLREVQKGLVIATVHWRVKGFKKPDVTRDGIFTQVFVQQADKWEITASQNTLIAID
jgi:uncharacterized protein (TIGR02246 family)